MLFLSVDLGVKRFNLTIRDAVQILAIFHNINFFLKKLLFFFSLKLYSLCLMFCLSNILCQRITYITLINTTYQKKISKTMNYLIILIKFKVSRFLRR
jgi:hypothetical protein